MINGISAKVGVLIKEASMAKVNKGILPVLIYFLSILLPMILFSYFFLTNWPLDGDETMRLDEARMILNGGTPFYDTLMVFSFPGFWLFLMPIVYLTPFYYLPFAARILSLAVFFVALAIFMLIQYLHHRTIYKTATLYSIALLLLIPELLYKAAECRPDTPAGALLLLGGSLFLLKSRKRARLCGLALIGLAVALKLEFALALAPLVLGWLVLLAKKKDNILWTLGLIIPKIIVAGVLLILVGSHIFEILRDIPALAGLAQMGKGNTEGQLALLPGLAMTLIFLLAMFELISKAVKPHGDKRTAFAIFAFGTGLFTFAFHLKMGAMFLHNYWFPVYFMAPLAGAFLARLSGFLPVGKGKIQSMLFAMIFVIAMAAAFSPIKSEPQSFNLQRQLSQWENLLGDEKGDLRAKGEFEGYADRKPLDVVKFLSFLHHGYGHDFTIYSNDFRSLSGLQLPPGTVAKLSTLTRVNKNIKTSLHGKRLMDIFQQRFPSALFLKDGKTLSPGAFLRSWEPDVIVADDTFYRMAISDEKLRQMLAEKYILSVAGGSVLVFERAIMMN